MGLYVVMGVSGCGKTTIGEGLADYLGCSFYDGDNYHPPQNVAKMASGIPLDDMDRAPWLAALAKILSDHAAKGETAVLACSALKRSYRKQLHVNEDVHFIFLEGDFDLIWQRMQARQNHYMKADMLRSQFETLEPPAAEEAIIIVPINQSVDDILAQLIDIISASAAA